jgi:hypothetical protein
MAPVSSLCLSPMNSMLERDIHIECFTRVGALINLTSNRAAVKGLKLIRIAQPIRSFQRSNNDFLEQ